MSLQFQTLSQQWLFTNAADMPPVPVNPEDLAPLTTYTIYLVVQNPDAFAQSGTVTITHSAFGIGLPGAVVATVPVTIPPLYDGKPGTETIAFTYATAPGGHGCLYAAIDPGGAFISQNTTVNVAPQGEVSLFSFAVYGGAIAETMILALTERVQGGAVLPPGDAASWSPVMVAPPGTGGPEDLGTATLTLNLAADVYDSVNLQVTIPPGATGTHVFHVVGTVNGTDVGEVDVVVHSQAAAQPAPDPYLMGGYQSADIILLDAANHAVPLGGMPGGVWDTLLVPNTDYAFQAIVHNDSPTDAVNTLVRFWSFPGGVGSAGTLVDLQTANVPAFGQVVVTAAHPFRSAPAGQHRCAAVSIFNVQSPTCGVDASTAASLTDPAPGGVSNPRSATAWRNTDSLWVYIGRPWTFELAATVPVLRHIPDPGPVEVEIAVAAHIVPADIERNPDIVALRRTLLAVGAQSRAPLYLADDLRRLLPAVDLGIVVKRADGARLEHGRQLATADRTLPFMLNGILPPTAKPGDSYLVDVTAQYHATKDHPARLVRFTQMLFVRS